MEIFRGDIFFIRKGGYVTGSEQDAGRPAVIVSNNTGNYHSKEGTRRLSRANDNAKKERKKAERKKKKDNKQAIIDISAEAKKAGMSYGKYVAMMGL